MMVFEVRLDRLDRDLAPVKYAGSQRSFHTGSLKNLGKMPWTSCAA